MILYDLSPVYLSYPTFCHNSFYLSPFHAHIHLHLSTFQPHQTSMPAPKRHGMVCQSRSFQMFFICLKCLPLFFLLSFPSKYTSAPFTWITPPQHLRSQIVNSRSLPPFPEPKEAELDLPLLCSHNLLYIHPRQNL